MTLDFPLASDDEIKSVEQMRSTLGRLLTASPISDFPEMVSDIYLLRLLRGRQNNVNEAIKLFHAHLAIREEFGMNEIRQTLKGRPAYYTQHDITHGVEVSQFYRIHVNAGSTPRWGHPVAFSVPAQHNTRALFQEVGIQKFNRYVIEEMLRRQMQLDQLSRKYNRLIKVILIPNALDVTVWNLTHTEMRENQKNVLKRIQETIPELMGRVYGIHVSWLTRNFYHTVLKWMLPKATRKKIFLLGSNYRDVLINELDTKTLALLIQSTKDGGGGESSGGGESADMTIKAGTTTEVIICVNPTKVKGIQWTIQVTKDIMFSVSRFETNKRTVDGGRVRSRGEGGEGESKVMVEDVTAAGAGAGAGAAATLQTLIVEERMILENEGPVTGEIKVVAGSLAVVPEDSVGSDGVVVDKLMVVVHDEEEEEEAPLIFVLHFSNQHSWMSSCGVHWEWEESTDCVDS